MCCCGKLLGTTVNKKLISGKLLMKVPAWEKEGRNRLSIAGRGGRGQGYHHAEGNSKTIDSFGAAFIGPLQCSGNDINYLSVVCNTPRNHCYCYVGVLSDVTVLYRQYFPLSSW